jgi:outer membrane protein, adhesin transport system
MKKRVKYSKLLVIIVFVFFSFNNLYSQEIYSFQQCLQIALENNYSIKIAKNNEQIATNNYSIGNAGFLPYVYASASQNYNITDSRQVLATSPDPVEKDNAKSNSLTASVNLSWTIFDGFQMFVQYDKLNEILEIGQLNTRLNIENMIAQVGIEYFTIIQQKKKLETIRYIKNLSKERMKVAEERYRIGQESKLEFQQAVVDFNSDSSQYLKQSEYLSGSIFRLNKLLAIKIENNTNVSDTINISKALLYDELVKETQQNNANLLIAIKNQNISELNLKIIKGSRYPKLSLYGSANFGQSESPTSTVIESNSFGWNYGASLSFNIFDGFDVNRQQKNAKIDVLKSGLEFDQLEQEIFTSLSILYNTYLNSLKLVDLEKENLQVARNNFEISMERYRLGTFSGLQMRDVQRVYLDAEDRLLAAQYEAKIAEISLKRLSGRIADYLI